VIITYGVTCMHLLVLLCRLNMERALFHRDGEGHCELKVQLTYIKVWKRVNWNSHRTFFGYPKFFIVLFQ